MQSQPRCGVLCFHFHSSAWKHGSTVDSTEAAVHTVLATRTKQVRTKQGNTAITVCLFVLVNWCAHPFPLCSKASRVMFYKVPFSAVPDLVARRQVLLRDGFAYVREAQVRCWLWVQAAAGMESICGQWLLRPCTTCPASAAVVGHLDSAQASLQDRQPCLCHIMAR